LDDNVAETRQITAEDFCRVLYVKSGDPTEYICGNVARCRRAGHREARSIPERVGLPGIYDVTLSDRGKVLGIVAATRQNAAAFAIRQEEQRAQNRLLTETIALMARQLDNLRRKMESSSHSTTTTSGCKHCGTALHSTSVACPWRSKATTNAKKLAAKALLTLSTGASAAVGAAAGAAAGAAEGAGTDS